MAGGDARDHLKPRLGVRVEIGVAHGVAVDRRVVERRQIDRRHDVARDHAPAGDGKRHRFDFRNRRHPLRDDALDLVHGEQRTREGKAIIAKLRHRFIGCVGEMDRAQRGKRCSVPLPLVGRD